MERESFIFYGSWWRSVRNAPVEVRAAVYDAICELALTGEVTTELPDVAGWLFEAFRVQIETNTKRYLNGCKGGGFGVLGGRPQNPKETPKKPQKNPKQTPSEPLMIYDNDTNVNVNENVNENVNDIKKETNKEKSGSAAPAVAKTIEEKQAEFYSTLIPYVGKYSRDMVRAFFDYWAAPLQNKPNTMLKETMKTWSLGGRLATWAKKDSEYNRNSVTWQDKQNQNRSEMQQIKDAVNAAFNISKN